MWKGGWTEGTGGPGWPSCTCIGGDKDADQKYMSFVIASPNTKNFTLKYINSLIYFVPNNIIYGFRQLCTKQPKNYWIASFPLIYCSFIKTFHRMFVQCHLWKAKTASVTMVISPRYVIPDLIIIKRTTIGFHLGLGLIDLLVGISQKN